jgi:hypothetical protein
MSQAYHQAVWIDHRVARIYEVTRTGAHETAVIHAPRQDRGNIHHKTGTPGSGHAPIPPAFLDQVGEAIRDGREILIVGPSDARHILARHFAVHFPALAARVIGVVSMARGGAGAIHTLAWPRFHQADLMPPSNL